MDDHHHHDIYNNLHPTAMDYSQFLPSDYSSSIIHNHHQNDVVAPQPPSCPPPVVTSATGSIIGLSDDATSSSDVKAMIASHPRYPRLLQSYIDCHKVGAPPEIEKALDRIWRDNELRRREIGDSVTCLGADPLLDDFMESYCEILEKYKADLAKPVNEATSFINDVETQLRHLCNYQGPTSILKGNALSTGGGMTSEEEEESEGDEEEKSRKDEEKQLKDELLRRFGSHISSLKLEFSKKKKKGKLPREARQMLFDWWNSHYKWPYPTESDKIALAEMTGLDPRQINNWFINQRKRHWKPSENMHFAFVNNTSGHYFTNDS